MTTLKKMNIFSFIRDMRDSIIINITTKYSSDDKIILD